MIYPVIDRTASQTITRRSRKVKVRAGQRPALQTRPERRWCSYCAMPAETWDHVEPWSQCFDNSLDNLVPACLQCNQDKGDLPLVVFLALTAPDGTS